MGLWNSSDTCFLITAICDEEVHTFSIILLYSLLSIRMLSEPPSILYHQALLSGNASYMTALKSFHVLDRLKSEYDFILSLSFFYFISQMSSSILSVLSATCREDNLRTECTITVLTADKSVKNEVKSEEWVELLFYLSVILSLVIRHLVLYISSLLTLSCIQKMPQLLIINFTSLTFSAFT